MSDDKSTRERLLQPLACEEVLRLRTVLGTRILSKPKELSLRFLEERGWVAVPMPDSIHENDAKNIAAAASGRCSGWAICFMTERAERPEGFRVAMTSQGVLEFSLNCFLRAFLLVPGSKEFAVLEEGNYFFIVAGPEDFVEEAVGGPLDVARREFQEYADQDWSGKERSMLQAVSERYKRPSAT